MILSKIAGRMKGFCFTGNFFVGILTGLLGLSVVGTAAEMPAAPRPMADLVRLQTEAESGVVDAALELALVHDLGQAGPRNAELAARWYQRAAHASPEAHLRLGMLCEAGDGMPQSFAVARNHYEQALAGGLPAANLRLGILHLEGWGVPRNPAEAVDRIKQAAEAEYRPAQRILSDMFAAGVGIKADRTEALAWAQRATRGEDPDAQVSLGLLLLNKLHRQEDLKLAREWYQLSVEQEYTRGMLALAATFFRPGAAPADVASGARWLELAAEGGNSAAAFYLAGWLLSDPSQRHETQAHGWLEQSARAGEHDAREVLELAATGRPLADAYKYVRTVPAVDRYVTRYKPRESSAGQFPTSTRIPVVLKIVEPVYPHALRLTKTTGEVLVEFIVDTTGRVRYAFVVRSSHPGFSERALEAVTAWRFSPGIKEGKVVVTRMQVPVHFTLSDIHPEQKARPETEIAPSVPVQ